MFSYFLQLTAALQIGQVFISATSNQLMRHLLWKMWPHFVLAASSSVLLSWQMGHIITKFTSISMLLPWTKLKVWMIIFSESWYSSISTKSSTRIMDVSMIIILIWLTRDLFIYDFIDLYSQCFHFYLIHRFLIFDIFQRFLYNRLGAHCRHKRSRFRTRFRNNPLLHVLNNFI